MKCSECNAEIADNAKFCPVCGAKVEKEEPVKICPNCGEVLKDGAKFCAKCGCKIEKECKCPKCGTAINESAKFCPVCRTPLSSMASNVEDVKDEETDEEPTEEKEIEDYNFHFVTKSPTFSTKMNLCCLLQSSSRLLKEFKVNNGTIYISTWNGKEINAPINECEFSYDNIMYCNIICVKHGDEKIVFVDISDLLREEEWKQITDFCIFACNAEKRNLNMPLVLFYIILGVIIIVLTEILLGGGKYYFVRRSVVVVGLIFVSLGIKRFFK